MSSLPYRSISRRALVSGLSAAALPVIGLHTAFGQTQPTAVTTGDCGREASVQMLFDWRAGKPVYTSVADAGPQID